MRVCVRWGHSPSREPVQSSRPPPGSGVPSPSTEIPARPLPTLPRRESGRAGDKETPASSTPGPSACPRHSPAPSLDPGDIARGHSGGSGAGRVSLRPDASHPEAARAPRPGTPHGSRAPHLPLAKPSRAPGTATPDQNHPHLPSRAIAGHGAHKAGWGAGGGTESIGEGEIRPGLSAGPARSYLPDFFFDLRDVCEDEEDHEQRERSQHPAPELQLHGGFAPAGTRADPGAERGRSLRARRAAGQPPCAPGESGPAVAVAATVADRGCSGAASPLAPSRLPPAPLLVSPPLPRLFPAPRGAPRAV